MTNHHPQASAYPVAESAGPLDPGRYPGLRGPVSASSDAENRLKCVGRGAELVRVFLPGLSAPLLVSNLKLNYFLSLNHHLCKQAKQARLASSETRRLSDTVWECLARPQNPGVWTSLRGIDGCGATDQGVIGA